MIWHEGEQRRRLRALRRRLAALLMVPPGTIRAYLVAAAFVFFGVLGRLALPDLFDEEHIHFMMLLPAVMLSALVCGARAGTFAVFLSAVAAWYFILPLDESFRFGDRGDFFGFLLFLVTSEMMVAVVSAMRWAIRRAEDADQMLLAAFESSPDGIIVFEPGGVIATMNQQSLRFFRGSYDDLVGLPLSVLFPQTSEYDELMRQAAAITTDGRLALATGLSLRARRRDGWEFPVHVHLAKMSRGGEPLIIASIRDLSQQQAIASAIADYALPDALYIYDHEGRFLRVNQQAAEATGYSREELTAMSITGLKRSFDLGAAQAEWLAMRPGEAKTVYADHYRKDGSHFPVEIRIAVLDSQAEPIYVAIVRDITERERAQELILQLQKVEAIGQLTSGIAHDFNNVLATITASLELVQLQAPPPMLVRLVDNALTAAWSGAELTHRLLAFARKRPLKVERLDLNALVSGMADLLARTVGPSISLMVDLAPACVEVATDRGQIENALLNLVINARDAMPKGGTITIATSIRQVVDDTDAGAGLRPGDYVVLAASDTGPGMTPEVLARAVEPFFSTKPEGRGTGLGLSIIDGFARDSGGRLVIASTPGQGTTVTILLPRAAPEASRQQSAAVETALPGGDETVLVVEDIAALRSIVVGLVETLGYRVVAASTAAEGLTLLGSRDDIALVFSDITLPGGLSGEDFARQVQEHFPGVKILLTSGQPPDPTPDASGQSCFPILDKPYRLRELAVALRSALDEDGSKVDPTD